ncbi:MAG: hypothetical protein IJ759_04195 [Bacteroidales bacterium]|nr:hypothetical protein [Bacteroidales bacterium]
MDKLKEKIGDWLFDIAKYIITAVVVTSLFQQFNEDNVLIYIVGILSASVFFISGALMFGFKIKNRRNEK